jgi:predicted glycoside hydrolase/deacetylase ChbG (UPF0249 family)
VNALSRTLPHGRPRLIVNADDFGLTEGINRAILELNAAGALTSATLMATGAAFRDAVHAAFVQTSLGVGCHVVLIDGTPVLPYAQIPTLATAAGFRPTLAAFVKALLRGQIKASEIEAEASAQIARVQSAGLTVSHIDTHKHTHMFAGVLRPLLAAAASSGITGIRNPFEPAWSLRATANAGFARRMQVTLLRTQHRGFQRAVKHAGLSTTDGAVGVLATGTLDAPTLRRLLQATPSGTWELVCHPGYHDAALAAVQTRLRASRDIERDALLEVFGQDNALSVELVNFHALQQKIN